MGSLYKMIDHLQFLLEAIIIVLSQKYQRILIMPIIASLDS